MAKEKNGFTGEYNYYVGILTRDNELRFVNSVDYSDKTCTWSEGASPLPMSKASAVQLQMGLMCNGSVALVIEAPDFQKFKNNKSYDNQKVPEETLADLFAYCVCLARLVAPAQAKDYFGFQFDGAVIDTLRGLAMLYSGEIRPESTFTEFMKDELYGPTLKQMLADLERYRELGGLS